MINSATVLSLHELILQICGNKVFPVDLKNKDDVKLVKTLCEVAIDTIHEIKAVPITAKRVNEVGNKIEPYIKRGINKYNGYTAEIPLGKLNGYPDILIKDKVERYTYIECKTYNKQSAESSFRSFYLSPSNRFKIVNDARHIVIALEIRYLENNEYVADGFKLIDVYNLKCKLKKEWNASNKELYGLQTLGAWRSNR